MKKQGNEHFRSSGEMQIILSTMKNMSLKHFILYACGEKIGYKHTYKYWLSIHYVKKNEVKEEAILIQHYEYSHEYSDEMQIIKNGNALNCMLTVKN